MIHDEKNTMWKQAFGMQQTETQNPGQDFHRSFEFHSVFPSENNTGGKMVIIWILIIYFINEVDICNVTVLGHRASLRLFCRAKEHRRMNLRQLRSFL